MPTASPYSISGLKTWQSREGCGYQANLLRDGKVVGWFNNDGNGGMTDLQFCKLGTFPENKEERAIFEKFLADQPEKEWPAEWVQPGENPMHKQDADGFLAELVDAYESKKKLKRLCAKKTLFSLVGEDPDKDGWHTLSAPYGEKVQKWLDDNYGDKVAEIANKTRI